MALTDSVRGIDMKKLFVAGIAAAAFCGTPAFAADMAVKAPPQPPAPVYSWTGFYVGGDVGYGWKDPTVTFSPNNIAGSVALGSTTNTINTTTAGPSSFGDKGAFGGVEAGYNLQVNKSWLVGVETDFSWSNIKGQGNTAFPIGGGTTAIAPTTANMTASQNVLWFGTVRPRVGWLATDNLLLYGTGGLAYGRVSDNVAYTNGSTAGVAYGADTSALLCFFPGNTCFAGAATHIATGWTAGAGLEYRITGTNVSIKLEYLYVNLGSGDAFNVVGTTTPPAGFRPGSFTATYSATAFQTTKIGMNWKF
jgi:outer membrane immunogenic protein